MKLFHGTSNETLPFTMYFTSDIVQARQFALGLTDAGDYNEESFIYATDINEAFIDIEPDFDVFDALAYQDPDLTDYPSGVVFNPTSGWYIVRKPGIILIEHYKNQL